MPSVLPLLDKPCAGWQRDLPKPNEPVEESAELFSKSPNYMDEIYLEISRRSERVRGVMLFFAVNFFVALLYTESFGFEGWGGFSFDVKLISIFTPVFAMYMIFLCLRLDCTPPRDEPLRFNRLRKKVYIYDFKYLWWNPFARWYVTPKNYNWNDLRAEEWKLRGSTPNGGVLIKWGVSVAVVKPGTNQVIDRFHLGLHSNVWAYVCAYMQQGPDALPPATEFEDPNRAPYYDLARCLAPKVSWPEDMDIESRSAP